MTTEKTKEEKVKTAFVEALAPELRREMRGKEVDQERFRKELQRQLNGRL